MKNFPEPVGKLGAQGVSLWPIPSVLGALSSSGQQECNTEAVDVGLDDLASVEGCMVHKVLRMGSISQ